MPLVQRAIATGIILAQVDLEFLFSAAEFPVFVCVGSNQVAAAIEPFPAQQEVSGGQATQVSHDGDAGGPMPGNRTEGLENDDGSDNHDEVFGLQRNEEAKKQGAIGEHNGIADQNSHDGAGSTDSAAVLSAENDGGDDDRESGDDAAGKVESQKAGGAPSALKLSAEHPKRQHIPEQVHDATMQEQVSDNLPDGEALQHHGWHQLKVVKERADLAVLKDEIEDGNGASDDQQPFSTQGETVRGNVSVRVRTGTQCHQVGNDLKQRITRKASTSALAISPGVFFENGGGSVYKNCDAQPDYPVG